MKPAYLLDHLVELALTEDLAGGDLTSEATVGENDRAIARAVAHTPLVVCGGDVFARVFYRVDPGVRVERVLEDGVRAKPGDVLWVVEGSTRSLLMAERTALNFAQRLTGTATLTRKFVDALPADAVTRIIDTRKTTPGMRFLERYAVRTGGGHNHRDNLGSAVLIKDNHIAAAGGVKAAIDRAFKHAPHSTRIECEVETLEMLDEALEAGADVVLLDNFKPEDITVAVERAHGRALIEVSGQITLDRIPALARAGVDLVSIGALTHSAPAADIGLDLEKI